MFDELVQNLIEALADAIAGTAVAAAEGQQSRRDTLADYEAKAKQHASHLLAGFAEGVRVAVRNRYAEWCNHPRLGHESMSAELHAAEIGVNEAVVALKGSQSPINRALAIGACIRLSAITEVLGTASIYVVADDRTAKLRPARVARAKSASGDKRVNRRELRLSDVPVELWPVVARLGASDAERAPALRELESARGGELDADGMITRLTTLATLDEHRNFTDELAAQVGMPEARPEPASEQESAEAPIAAVVTPLPGPEPVAGPPVERLREEVAAVDSHADEITTVASFVSRNRWALHETNGRLTLKTLKTRADINRTFNRVADLPAMQEALRAIHASPATPSGGT